MVDGYTISFFSNEKATVNYLADNVFENFDVSKSKFK